MTAIEREELVRFKKKIDGFLKGSDKEDKGTIMDILGRIKEAAVTVKDLEATEIGISVNKLRKESGDAATQAEAKAIMKGWKRMAKGETDSPRNGKKAKSGAPSIKVSTPKASAPKASTPRSDPHAGVPPMPESLTDHLDVNRKRSAKGLYGFMYKPWKAHKLEDKVEIKQVFKLAVDLEAAIDKKCPDTHAYASKLRSLASNMGKNVELFCELVYGIVNVTELVNMSSEELAPAAQREANKKALQDAIDERRSDYQDANLEKTQAMLGIGHDGMFTCGKCKSENTTFFQLQTRSSDEPMTSFIRCIDCNNRWRD